MQRTFLYVHHIAVGSFNLFSYMWTRSASVNVPKLCLQLSLQLTNLLATSTSSFEKKRLRHDESQ